MNGCDAHLEAAEAGCHNCFYRLMGHLDGVRSEMRRLALQVDRLKNDVAAAEEHASHWELEAQDANRLINELVEIIQRNKSWLVSMAGLDAGMTDYSLRHDLLRLVEILEKRNDSSESDRCVCPVPDLSDTNGETEVCLNAHGPGTKQCKKCSRCLKWVPNAAIL